jgi:hypothetical protein
MIIADHPVVTKEYFSFAGTVNPGNTTDQRRTMAPPKKRIVDSGENASQMTREPLSLRKVEALKEMFFLAGSLALPALPPEHSTWAAAVHARYANKGDFPLILAQVLGREWANSVESVGTLFSLLEEWYSNNSASNEQASLFVGGASIGQELTKEGRVFFELVRLEIDLKQLAKVSTNKRFREATIRAVTALQMDVPIHKPLERTGRFGQSQKAYSGETAEGSLGVGEEQQQKSGEQVQPLIALEDVRKVEIEVARLQAPAVQRFQEMLLEWTGKRTKSDDDNKELAERIKQMAATTGTRLYFKGKPVSIRWNAGVFVAFSADNARSYVGSGSELIPLEAKPIVDTGLPGTQDHSQETAISRVPPKGGQKRK